MSASRRKRNISAANALLATGGIVFLLNQGFPASELRKLCALVADNRELLTGAYNEYFA